MVDSQFVDVGWMMDGLMKQPFQSRLSSVPCAGLETRASMVVLYVPALMGKFEKIIFVIFDYSKGLEFEISMGLCSLTQ